MQSLQIRINLRGRLLQRHRVVRDVLPFLGHLVHKRLALLRRLLIQILLHSRQVKSVVVDFLIVQVLGMQRVVHCQNAMPVEYIAKVLLGAVLDVQQPLRERVVKQSYGSRFGNHEDPPEEMKAFPEILRGHFRVVHFDDVVQQGFVQGTFSGEDYVQQRLHLGELPPVEQSLAQPKIQTVQRSRYLSDLPEHDKIIGNAV